MKYLLLIFIINLSLMSFAFENQKRPSWIDSLPKDKNNIYVVGESYSLADKDESLEKAWISGLIRIGMTQFPELSKVGMESTETLNDSQFRKAFVLKIQNIDWTGLKEMDNLGSPYVEFDEKTNKYKVFRLLKWSISEMTTSKKKLKQPKLPLSPEKVKENEEALIQEVESIQNVNKKIESRDEQVSRVLLKAKCGITLKNLYDILGAPDREDYFNSNSYGSKKYYWGTFEAEHSAHDPTIRSITEKNGHGKTHYICSN